MFDLTAETVSMLEIAGFAGGFVDAIAGGGGLITVPALLLAGLPPVDALGTNKLQALFGAGSATHAYASNGYVDPRRQLPSALMAVAGGALGAVVATVVPADILRAALPVVLVAIALYFAIKPSMGDIDRVRRLSPLLFALLLVPTIGFYDGIFGPGAGSFYMLAYVALAGFGVLKATAHTQLLNLSSNAGGFLVFMAVGAIFWKVGRSMGVAQFLGARTGARLAIRTGARLIKPLLVVVCVALAANCWRTRTIHCA